jgi:hypothetical protein
MAGYEPRWRIARWFATSGAVLAVSVVIAACGASTPLGGAPASSPTPRTTAVPGTTAATGPSTPLVTVPATTTPARTAVSGCTLSAITAIAAESTGADQAQTASWVLLRANGWTVDAPNEDWHLSASDAGADVLSPDGTSDASLSTWYAQSRWTAATLAQKVLGSVSNFDAVCSSPDEQGSTGATVATEFTGEYQDRPIHGIIILSLLTPTVPDLYVGEIRSMYTPASAWSATAAQTLMLIIKRAIQDPQRLTP